MKRVMVVLIVVVLIFILFNNANFLSASSSLFNWIDELSYKISGREINQPNNINTQPNQPQRPDLRHLEPIEIPIRDLVAEGGQYHSRRVIVGPLRVMGNNLERQSFWGYEVTGAQWGHFSTSTVYIEVFYSNMPDADTTWRYYDGSYSEAIIVEGIFFLYKDENNKGAIHADQISILHADDYTE